MLTIIRQLATLDINNLSARDKRAALADAASKAQLSPSALINKLRDARTVSLSLSHVDSMYLDNAVAIALTRVALFNARRCYHA